MRIVVCLQTHNSFIKIIKRLCLYNLTNVHCRDLLISKKKKTTIGQVIYSVGCELIRNTFKNQSFVIIFLSFMLTIFPRD